jgi:hypothetical protein
MFALCSPTIGYVRKIKSLGHQPLPKATSDTIATWGNEHGHVRPKDISKDSGESGLSVDVSGALEWVAARTMRAVTLSETRRRKPLVVHTPGT